MRLGTWEIFIILVVVLLIFGPGRIVKVAGEMGKSIKAFKEGLNEGKETGDAPETKEENEQKK
jgi:sec-independent protein translocase protein TatA